MAKSLPYTTDPLYENFMQDHSLSLEVRAMPQEKEIRTLLWSQRQRIIQRSPVRIHWGDDVENGVGEIAASKLAAYDRVMDR